MSALTALTFVSVPRAEACKCALPSVEAAKGQATAVFEGRVRAIATTKAADGAGDDTHVVTLAIVRTWKGVENDELIDVRTSGSTASCGIAFEKDVSYLVYAANGAQGLEAGSCGRTRALADAAEDLAALGAGVTPVHVKPAPKAKGDSAKKPPAVKHSGCGTTSATGQMSASLWLLAPCVALFARRRRIA